MKTTPNENKSRIKKWNQFLMTIRNNSIKEMEIEEGEKRKDYETSSQSKNKYVYKKMLFWEKLWFIHFYDLHGVLKRKFFDFE